MGMEELIREAERRLKEFGIPKEYIRDTMKYVKENRSRPSVIAWLVLARHVDGDKLAFVLRDGEAPVAYKTFGWVVRNEVSIAIWSDRPDYDYVLCVDDPEKEVERMHEKVKWLASKLGGRYVKIWEDLSAYLLPFLT